jgi:hypothetical protein
MLSPVIKYFLLLVVIPAVIYGQASEIINHNFAQESGELQTTASESKPISKISLTKRSEVKRNNEITPILRERQPIEFFRKNNKVESSFNIVSSFRSNIRFGGFWGKYAIVNFSPQVNVKPFDFMSVYANHNFSCFIPIKGIKEHFKMLCIQGVSILAVDNAVKFIFGSDNSIPALAGFALKTIIINSVMSKINKGKKNKIYDNVSYYYSISIKF